MRIEPTALADVLWVREERREDERGYFARTFCEDELARAGVPMRAWQMNASFNRHAGTVRGLHYQRDPHGEPKLVRVTRGRIFDVAVDVRPGSPTYGRWVGAELDAERGDALYIPTGFAHGFQTLEDQTEVLYVMGARYVAEAATGIRHDDPRIGIVWPAPVSVISERDRLLPELA